MKITILITTRNRGEKLVKLLDSLKRSSKYISEIVIVSSGVDIGKDIDAFRNSISINHYHSEIPGQIYQKIRGIELINQNIDWVLLLDDDVEISLEAIETLIHKYLSNPNYESVFGFGLKIENLYMPKFAPLTKTLLSLFGLYSKQKGIVLKSGHAQHYQNSDKEIETEWLNGISAWRLDALYNYEPSFPLIDYAAYEDVIFSYKISKNKSLMFVPQVCVNTQENESYKRLTYVNYKAGSYMRFLFVSENSNLSKSRLIIAQLIRTIYFTFNGDLNFSVQMRFRFAFFIWIDLLVALILRTDSRELLKKRYS